MTGARALPVCLLHIVPGFLCSPIRAHSYRASLFYIREVSSLISFETDERVSVVSTCNYGVQRVELLQLRRQNVRNPMASGQATFAQ
jgi:hypothetical protein